MIYQLLSTLAQHNALHLQFTLLQRCYAVVGAEMEIQVLQLTPNAAAVDYEQSFNTNLAVQTALSVFSDSVGLLKPSGSSPVDKF